MSTSLPPGVDSGIDDRMFTVQLAYFEAVAAGDDQLAEELAAAIKAGDVERGVKIMERVPPGPPLPESGQGR